MGRHGAAQHCAQSLSARSSSSSKVGLHPVPVLSLASLPTSVYQIENHPELFDVTNHLPNTPHTATTQSQRRANGDRETARMHACCCLPGRVVRSLCRSNWHTLCHSSRASPQKMLLTPSSIDPPPTPMCMGDRKRESQERKQVKKRVKRRERGCNAKQGHS